jgi:hypothetical protein
MTELFGQTSPSRRGQSRGGASGGFRGSKPPAGRLRGRKGLVGPSRLGSANPITSADLAAFSNGEETSSEEEAADGIESTRLDRFHSQNLSGNQYEQVPSSHCLGGL